MSLSLSVLGSGSGGNCALVVLHDRVEPRNILIDAGLSPQETANRLGPLGYRLNEISDIIVTHTDHDHL
ncbi:MAG: MBL fold metallo-hydrolase, partial [Phycisphaerales bacterium]